MKCKKCKNDYSFWHYLSYAGNGIIKFPTCRECYRRERIDFDKLI